MWFDDIKKHSFYKHPVYIQEYFTYYGMMRDDVEDVITQEQNQMKEIDDYCKRLSKSIPKLENKQSPSVRQQSN